MAAADKIAVPSFERRKLARRPLSDCSLASPMY